MKLTPNNNRMTEQEADLEVKRRDAYWLHGRCAINHLGPCLLNCHSYNEAYKKKVNPSRPDKGYQVKDGYCSSPLVTGTIEYEGCECG